MPEGEQPAAAAASAGILYSAAGAAHVAEAVRSARSSLRHNQLPHLLFASEPVQGAPPGLEVALFEPSGNPYADKIANMAGSPFQRTIYLDTDTYVVGEIGHVLALLDQYELAAAYAAGYRGMADPDVPQAFYELNTGVLAWRSDERTAAFMRSWQETYLQWVREQPFPGAGRPLAETAAAAAGRAGAADQPAFRHCAWLHGLRVFVLAPEYNLRLGEPATVVERVRVIHGRHPDYESLAARVNDRRGPRRWPRPVPLRTRVWRVIRRGGRR